MSRDDEFSDGKNSERPSKSKTQKKREMTALQKLGEELVALKIHQLRKMPLPEELLQAVLEAQQMKAHGAKRRQMQYLGALMRQVDARPIRDALQQLLEHHGSHVGGFHLVQDWRDRLVEGDQALMKELCENFPDVEHGEMHRMVMQARKERETGKPRGAGRSLFRFLMDRYRQSRAEKTQ